MLLAAMLLQASGGADPRPLRPRASPPASPSLWPIPRNVTGMNAGPLVLQSDVDFVVAAGGSNLVDRALDRCRATIFRRGAPASRSLPDGVMAAITATITVGTADTTLNLATAEDYTLTITAAPSAADPRHPPRPASVGAITISAPTAFGVLHALETLAQLVVFDALASRYTVSGPVSITDAPRFKHRELMLDVARFYLPLPLLRAVVDAMAIAKLNVLHVHATDSESFPLVLASRPEFAGNLSFSPRERYTKADFRQLTAFARDRGVRVYLELDLPSHTGDFLSDGWCAVHPGSCPEPRCRHNALDPRPSSGNYDIIADMVTELATFTDDEYIHLGGDELLQDALSPHDCWQAAPEIAAWMNVTFPPAGRDPRGAGGAVEHFNNKIEALARNAGQKAIRWEEAFYYSCCLAPSYTDPCPGGFVDGCTTSKDTIVHHWRAGAAWSGELVKLAAGHGYTMITSAGWYLAGNASAFYAVEPCAGVSDTLCASQVLGGGGALWQAPPGEVIATAFPNVAAIAERLWSSKGGSWDAGVEARYAAFHCYLGERGVQAGPLDHTRPFGSCLA